MIVECTNCGAPLDVADNAGSVRCSYCNKANRVRTMRTIAQERPAEWQPPREWTPPSHLPARGRQLRYQRPGRSRTGCLLATAVVVMIAGGAVPLWLTGAVKQPDLPELSVLLGGWDGTEPFACDGNDSVTIEGRTVSFANRTAFTVSGNCELRIVDCDVTAHEGLRADGNRNVTIERSRFRTTGIGINARGNRRVELIDSQVIADGLAVQASANAHVTVSGGQIAGAPTAFSAEDNGLVEPRGATVVHRPENAEGATNSATGGVANGDEIAAKVEIDGPLSTSMINTVMERQARRFSRCAGDDPSIVSIQFAVDPQGRVRTATVLRSTGKARSVGRCVTQVVERLRFPAAPSGGITTVTWPVVLTPR